MSRRDICNIPRGYSGPKGKFSIVIVDNSKMGAWRGKGTWVADEWIEGYYNTLKKALYKLKKVVKEYRERVAIGYDGGQNVYIFDHNGKCRYSVEVEDK